MAADLELLIGDSMATTGARIAASRRRRKKSPRSPLRLIAWLAGVSVIAAAVVVTVKAVVGGGDGEPTPAVAAVGAIDAGVAGLTPPADAASPVPRFEQAQIRITSRPAGVEVFAEGRSHGVTPFLFEPIKENRTIVLVGSKDGYDDRKLEVNPAIDDGKEVPIVLKKARRGGGVRLDRGGTSATPAGSGASPPRDNTAGGDLIPPRSR
jgi:hypothetical protein